MPSGISLLDLTKYEQRLVTFRNWNIDFFTPHQMAEAGFYYTGDEDCVKCVFCPTEFGYWCRTDDPLKEHKRLSPECKFFLQKEEQGDFFQ